MLNGHSSQWCVPLYQYAPAADRSRCVKLPAFSLIYTLNNSSCRKPATQRIPWSVHKYVTGVSEESQRTCSLKYDGYTRFRADSQTPTVSLSARTPSSFRCPPDNNGIRLCVSASYDDLHCYQKSRVTPREQCLFSSCTLIHAVRNTIFKVQKQNIASQFPSPTV
ncbi:Uncharacterised protein [Salmonella enterica subsp. enterica serovar Sanjuan]|uniref:Uncharacterized protein n=1 Tax=Salmonella enterica subsp. enterica serovar Sanjuan TaxID=1160765 RepID=A0A3S4FMH9_SALET|nr:Uncharacterised protein [Salmonella enterica subsp. enterica serovar Sanjuan]